MSNKLNILVAYPYMKKEAISILKENEDQIQFVLDSGAFTAWKAGKSINVDDYCKFIESLPFKPWKYFNLDVIGDSEASFKNYEIMRERGFNPIPIFTRGENIEMIDKYYETSDILGIGGLVGTPKNKGFVKGVMSKIGDRKVHWLGFNAKDFIIHYKPYMCDSSSWSFAVRFASCLLYDLNGKWYHISKQDFITRPSDEILNIFEKYQLNPRRLSNSSEWKNSSAGKYALEELTYKSWTRYQIDLNQKLGVNFFIACASGAEIRLMKDAFNFWKKEGIS